MPSLPARGARIEIGSEQHVNGNAASLPARGARIEIENDMFLSESFDGRSPQGERGLKYEVGHHEVPEAESLPARGARIEI